MPEDIEALKAELESLKEESLGRKRTKEENKRYNLLRKRIQRGGRRIPGLQERLERLQALSIIAQSRKLNREENADWRSIRKALGSARLDGIIKKEVREGKTPPSKELIRQILEETALPSTGTGSKRPPTKISESLRETLKQTPDVRLPVVIERIEPPPYQTIIDGPLGKPNEFPGRNLEWEKRSRQAKKRLDEQIIEVGIGFMESMLKEALNLLSFEGATYTDILRTGEIYIEQAKALDPEIENPFITGFENNILKDIVRSISDSVAAGNLSEFGVMARIGIYQLRQIVREIRGVRLSPSQQRSGDRLKQNRIIERLNKKIKAQKDMRIVAALEELKRVFETYRNDSKGLLDHWLQKANEAWNKVSELEHLINPTPGEKALKQLRQNAGILYLGLIEDMYRNAEEYGLSKAEAKTIIDFGFISHRGKIGFIPSDIPERLV